MKKLLLLLFVGTLVTSCSNENKAGQEDTLGQVKPYSETLQTFTDFDEAVAYAKEKNRPLLVDFTGWACVNCRKMEENVWPDQLVKDAMSHYVLVSLYVDDKRQLPKDQQGEVNIPVGDNVKTKKIKTIGNKWAVMQMKTFQANSQPYYALLSPDGKLLSEPTGYTPSTEDYTEFLKKGIEIFKKGGGEPMEDILNYSREIADETKGTSNSVSNSGLMDPVSWVMKHEHVKDNEYDLVFTATIEEGWHLYSQHLPGADGPVPTEFLFEKSDAFEIVGEKATSDFDDKKWLVKVEEGKYITHYDHNFQMDLNYFENSATFRQRIKVNEDAVTVKGEVGFMVCNDEMCLPPNYIAFGFNIQK